MKTTLFALYRAPVNLWVEDPLTYYVLTDLFSDRDINVIITQGKPAVRYMVRSNPDPDRHVFGLVDRDFDEDNEARWLHPDCRVFHVPAHEFENLLLDFEVLATLAKGVSAAEIEALACKRAIELKWWMAHKAVVRTMQRELGAGFPVDAPADGALGSADDVERLLRESEYWTEHEAALRRWAQGTMLHDEVLAWGRRLQADLDADQWRFSFSGKEIFRYLRSYVRGLDEAPARPPKPSAAERDINLGKRIARRMNEMGRVPAKLRDLHDVVRRKAGL